MVLNFHSRLVVLAALFLLGAWESLSAAPTLEETSFILRHERWMSLHGRSYKNETEKSKRFTIFKENVKFIEKFNKVSGRSFKLGTNKFTDLTKEEFRATLLNEEKSTPYPKTSKPTSFVNESLAEVPESLDWREQGAVTNISVQGKCGAWAFAVVAAVEGITKIKTGQLISLSEQQLIDCDFNNGGCSGGNRTEAFQFIKDSGGLMAESDYPYEGVEASCNTQTLSNPAATITGYQEVEATESALLAAVTNQPVSVGIDLGQLGLFQHYATGIFDGDCGSGYRHDMTIIGYGTSDEYGIDYWLVKNSWGISWGESGYMKMARGINAQGVCNLNTRASYPIA
ncbi:PREDICTED: zingipain-2-like isoform X2 [Ipomoea nil]|uniref:zingipain-2-like isoform X2 n=1 Tax=Ipomoea nil TaxID=35883 RepID=UPI000901A119|nr:PREDICTED: zingipain-2-like isoform X2 [Ipomoea nil]